eukprot:CAMPEP_0198132610 /NCGR_PEP_ID=MMETSP1442-20131203/58688_1 /TAXON_ID= /ORGANISM="Craspedostauros australis, Strain CCMP3328" /LENGTH=302 /DNA_ID=CAMNT_0043793655 /DNA_START=16 /DNA_END=921 /DNA_ORIENTATION=-
MSFNFMRFARASHAGALSAVLAQSFILSNQRNGETMCDSGSTSSSNSEAGSLKVEPKDSSAAGFGMMPDAKGDFGRLFPKRQLWQPRVKYPLWDDNWDGKKPELTGDSEQNRQRMRKIRKEGVTRHIILVRHGQYEEDHKDETKKILTPLGREQADLTGKRLREMLDGVSKEFGPCNINVVRVSDMTRAKETADLIAAHLPAVPRAEPDPDLNEGRPCHNIPGGRASPSTIQKTDETHPRIERAFAKYFYRAPFDENKEQDESEGDVDAEEQPKHEFEIIVCHANVIRYFLCRALQMPPEAW